MEIAAFAPTLVNTPERFALSFLDDVLYHFGYFHASTYRDNMFVTPRIKRADDAFKLRGCDLRSLQRVVFTILSIQ